MLHTAVSSPMVIVSEHLFGNGKSDLRPGWIHLSPSKYIGVASSADGTEPVPG